MAGFWEKVGEWIATAAVYPGDILELREEIRQLREDAARLELERLAAITRGNRLEARLTRVRRLVQEAAKVSTSTVIVDEGGDP